MTFDEDRCRIRTGNAADNFGLIRRAALNRLRTAPNPDTKRANRIPHAWGEISEWDLSPFGGVLPVFDSAFPSFSPNALNAACFTSP